MVLIMKHLFFDFLTVMLKALESFKMAQHPKRLAFGGECCNSSVRPHLPPYEGALKSSRPNNEKTNL